MSRTIRNTKHAKWYRNPSHWLKENNRPYRTKIKQLLRVGKIDDVPVNFGAHWKRTNRGWYW